jgi:hypothetical protein
MTKPKATRITGTVVKITIGIEPFELTRTRAPINELIGTQTIIITAVSNRALRKPPILFLGAVCLFLFDVVLGHLYHLTSKQKWETLWGYYHLAS